MSFATAPAWAWIPIAIAAAALQTARNAAQRSLVQDLGTLAATLVRFLYGIPFALLWLWLVLSLSGTGWSAAWPGGRGLFWAWLLVGAMAQILATAFLLMAMQARNFVFGVALARTEILQTALFGVLLLGEVPGWVTTLAMLCATAGVLLLALPKAQAAGGAASSTGGAGLAGMAGMVGANRAAWAGLAAGACFALAAVGYRGAALTQPGVSPWVVGAWGVLLAQLLQTAVLGAWIALRDADKFARILQAWRLSTVAGAMGAAASVGWFTAFALRPVADIKTLGMIEVLFSYVVSRKLFDESLTPREKGGLALLTLGLAVICTQL
jgi:drug/metabolite transporter (DMT)-like permease